ncbi:MAG: hypothetical protein WAV41_01400 [Microgenomates group bacterium]
MCRIKTFVGEPASMAQMLAEGKAVSTATMHRWQAEHLNPDLKACGTLPQCRACEDNPLALSIQELVEATANRLQRADLW